MQTNNVITLPEKINLPRRRFVKGIAMGGALLGLGGIPEHLLAATTAPSAQPTLKGKHFKLNIGLARSP